MRVFPVDTAGSILSSALLVRILTLSLVSIPQLIAEVRRLINAFKRREAL